MKSLAASKKVDLPWFGCFEVLATLIILCFMLLLFVCLFFDFGNIKFVITCLKLPVMYVNEQSLINCRNNVQQKRFEIILNRYQCKVLVLDYVVSNH